MLKRVFFLFLLNSYCIYNSSFYYNIPRDTHSDLVKVSSINEKLYLVEDFNYWKTNTLIYISKEKVYFFGTGWSSKSAQQILWKAKSLTTKEFQGVFLIAPTLDYSGGIFEFRINENVPIYIHKAGYSYLLLEWEKWQEEMKEKFQSWIIERQTPSFDGLLDDSLEIENGEIMIFYPEEIFVPGNLVVYFPYDKLIYGGNLFFDPDEYHLYLNSRQKQFLENYKLLLRKLKRLDIEIIISGKGSPYHKKNLLFEIEKYLNSFSSI
ncbi:MAG: hypothetical protein NZ853_08940 [Leptospiraceae bacterium]|nr:hypothetical protein [Leptospiraceae bacterium]MDW7975553.1 hypothetical protein [Leptospiraceae bacterium]